MTESDLSMPMETPKDIGRELDVARRREVALRTADIVAEVLEADVTIPQLQALSEQTLPVRRGHKPEKTPVARLATRALRAIQSISKEDSTMLQVVGENGIYHYAEGVIEYGASDSMYLTLIGEHGMDPEEVTALYSLREMIAEHTNGRKPGFATLEAAMRRLNMTMKQAAGDPEAAVTMMSDAGFFLDHKYAKVFNQPIFSPKLAELQPMVEDDTDGTITIGILEGFRAHFSRDPDEIDDETEKVEATDVQVRARQMLYGDED